MDFFITSIETIPITHRNRLNSDLLILNLGSIHLSILGLRNKSSLPPETDHTSTSTLVQHRCSQTLWWPWYSSNFIPSSYSLSTRNKQGTNEFRTGYYYVKGKGATHFISWTRLITRQFTKRAFTQHNEPAKENANHFAIHKINAIVQLSNYTFIRPCIKGRYRVESLLEIMNYGPSPFRASISSSSWTALLCLSWYSMSLRKNTGWNQALSTLRFWQPDHKWKHNIHLQHLIQSTPTLLS